MPTLFDILDKQDHAINGISDLCKSIKMHLADMQRGMFEVGKQDLGHSAESSLRQLLDAELASKDSYLSQALAAPGEPRRDGVEPRTLLMQMSEDTSLLLNLGAKGKADAALPSAVEKESRRLHDLASKPTDAILAHPDGVLAKKALLVPDKDGRTALHELVDRDETLENAHVHDKLNSMFPAVAESFATALQETAEKGSWTGFENSLDGSSDSIIRAALGHSVDASQGTLLHLMATHSQISVGALAALKPHLTPAYLGMRNAEGETALHTAGRHGHVDAMVGLAAIGVDLAMPHGRTGLDAAAFWFATEQAKSSPDAAAAGKPVSKNAGEIMRSRLRYAHESAKDGNSPLQNAYGQYERSATPPVTRPGDRPDAGSEAGVWQMPGGALQQSRVRPASARFASPDALPPVRLTGRSPVVAVATESAPMASSVLSGWSVPPSPAAKPVSDLALPVRQRGVRFSNVVQGPSAAAQNRQRLEPSRRPSDQLASLTGNVSMKEAQLFPAVPAGRGSAAAADVAAAARPPAVGSKGPGAGRR